MAALLACCSCIDYNKARGDTSTLVKSPAPIADEIVVVRSKGRKHTNTNSSPRTPQKLTQQEASQLAESKKRAALFKTPQEVLSELQRGNIRFWTDAPLQAEESAQERRADIALQWPSVAILCCSDARVPVELLFDLDMGDAFVVRVAGSCLDRSTLASLQYAVNHLQVKVLVVLGHEGCDAVRVASGAVPGVAIDAAHEELAGLVRQMKEGLDHGILGRTTDRRAHERVAAVANVRRQIEALARQPEIMQKVWDGELVCTGAFYTMSSGIVDFFAELSAEDHSYGIAMLSPPVA
eukprot:TRINITY_DN5679_c0_g1_i1.p1 TRINITY_DN5679_c0_g1~~TRINITY_DN5679_c0_g1_i1.p1  ORF type:complete len:321 (+),score=53.00 TRINITY_DN5679_c0_g1_i1:81-965(+)